MQRKPVTPEVYTIAIRAWHDERPSPPPYTTEDEVDAMNRRVAERLNIDLDRAVEILTGGPDRWAS